MKWFLDNSARPLQPLLALPSLTSLCTQEVPPFPTSPPPLPHCWFLGPIFSRKLWLAVGTAHASRSPSNRTSNRSNQDKKQ